MLPLDVASRGSKYGGIPMDILWIAVYIVTFLITIILAPFAYFLYENWDPDNNKSGCFAGFRGLIIFLLVFAIVSGVTYVFFGTAEVPIVVQKSSLVDFDRPMSDNECTECDFSTESTRMDMQVSFLLYFIAILALFGGLLFVVFGGIGLVTNPYDLINNFRLRPKPISDKEFEERKIMIGEVAEALIKEAEEYKRKVKSKKKFNKWRSEIYLLEEEWDKTVEANKRNGIRIIWYIFSLILGIIGIILTLVWVLHIFLYNLFGVTPFLNAMFYSMDGIWSFFGIIFFGIFSMWLMWCVIAGNFKFGLRVPFIFKLHPMKPNGTMLNSFLFNVILIGLSSVAVTQFCTQSFNLYARLTRINFIFGLAIFELRILRYFWIVYTWALLAMMLLTCIYLFFKPREKRVNQLGRLKK